MNSLKLLAAALSCAALWTVSLSAQTTPLVNHGDTWRYRKGTNAPAANWKTAANAALDSTWLTGAGGFGFADNAPETALCATLLPDMKGSAATNYLSLYMRKEFTVASTLDPNLHLFLSMDFDDGFIAWLDGVYLTSQNVAGAPTEPLYSAVASGLHESSRGSGGLPASTNDLGAIGSRLAPGTHTLAIIGLNQANTSTDFIQIADLFAAPPANCLSGSILANTIWRATNSPILVCGSVTIASGVTLTIEPGVTVQLGSGVSLTVANGGILLAEGTSNAPIHFTRSGASGNWGSIIINGAVGSPESRITWADFQFNAASTGTPCIEVNVGTAFLDHLAFGNTGAPYIHVDGASFIISHCYFPSATASFELCHGTAGIKSGGHGIFLRNYFGTTSGYNDVVDFSGGNRPGPIVQFFENVFTGSDDDALDLDSTDAWVEGNIFLHIHKNGAPDSSSGVSGGSDNASNSEITIVRNIFFDCDQAATAKQTNFFTLFNNTIVHQTHAGGLDSTGGVVNVRDTPDGGSPTSYGRGYYLEGNLIFDTEQLVRNYDAAQVTVTLSNNLLPSAWAGPGGGNVLLNPMLKHIPTLAETAFTNWAAAQIMWDWFSLLPGSPAIGTGPNGTDMGAVIPMGASISGVPPSPTTNTTALLRVGFVRAGGGIPAGGFPNGTGYYSYKWRLDGAAWSLETPISTPITLTGLANGTHQVEVSGRRDTTLLQDDLLLGDVGVLSQSRTWTVQALVSPHIDSVERAGTVVMILFTAQAGQTYSVFARDAFDGAHPWAKIADIASPPATGPYRYTNSPATPPARFYRLVTPAQ